jgi:hypothetical protein
VAALIADARFIVLDGDIGYPYFGDSSFIDQVDDFLSEERAPIGAARNRAVQTILFTDFAGSTAMQSRLGDAGAREVVPNPRRGDACRDRGVSWPRGEAHR